MLSAAVVIVALKVYKNIQQQHLFHFKKWPQLFASSYSYLYKIW